MGTSAKEQIMAAFRSTQPKSIVGKITGVVKSPVFEAVPEKHLNTQSSTNNVEEAHKMKSQLKSALKKILGIRTTNNTAETNERKSSEGQVPTTLQSDSTEEMRRSQESSASPSINNTEEPEWIDDDDDDDDEGGASTSLQEVQNIQSSAVTEGMKERDSSEEQVSTACRDIKTLIDIKQIHKRRNDLLKEMQKLKAIGTIGIVEETKEGSISLRSVQSVTSRNGANTDDAEETEGRCVKDKPTTTVLEEIQDVNEAHKIKSRLEATSSKILAMGTATNTGETMERDTGEGQVPTVLQNEPDIEILNIESRHLGASRSIDNAIEPECSDDLEEDISASVQDSLTVGISEGKEETDKNEGQESRALRKVQDTDKPPVIDIDDIKEVYKRRSQLLSALQKLQTIGTVDNIKEVKEVSKSLRSVQAIDSSDSNDTDGIAPMRKRNSESLINCAEETGEMCVKKKQVSSIIEKIQYKKSSTIVHTGNTNKVHQLKAHVSTALQKIRNISSIEKDKSEEHVPKILHTVPDIEISNINSPGEMKKSQEPSASSSLNDPEELECGDDQMEIEWTSLEGIRCIESSAIDITGETKISWQNIKDIIGASNVENTEEPEVRHVQEAQALTALPETQYSQRSKQTDRSEEQILAGLETVRDIQGSAIDSIKATKDRILMTLQKIRAVRTNDNIGKTEKSDRRASTSLQSIQRIHSPIIVNNPDGIRETASSNGNNTKATEIEKEGERVSTVLQPTEDSKSSAVNDTDNTKGIIMRNVSVELHRIQDSSALTIVNTKVEDDNTEQASTVPQTIQDSKNSPVKNTIKTHVIVRSRNQVMSSLQKILAINGQIQKLRETQHKMEDHRQKVEERQQNLNKKEGVGELKTSDNLKNIPYNGQIVEIRELIVSIPKLEPSAYVLNSATETSRSKSSTAKPILHFKSKCSTVDDSLAESIEPTRRKNSLSGKRKTYESDALGYKKYREKSKHNKTSENPASHQKNRKHHSKRSSKSPKLNRKGDSMATDFEQIYQLFGFLTFTDESEPMNSTENVQQESVRRKTLMLMENPDEAAPNIAESVKEDISQEGQELNNSNEITYEETSSGQEERSVEDLNEMVPSEELQIRDEPNSTISNNKGNAVVEERSLGIFKGVEANKESQEIGGPNEKTSSRQEEQLQTMNYSKQSNLMNRDEEVAENIKDTNDGVQMNDEYSQSSSEARSGVFTEKGTIGNVESEVELKEKPNETILDIRSHVSKEGGSKEDISNTNTEK